MELLFAPMEGITDSIFRTVHASVFGGIDHYYIPFVSPTENGHFDTRELRLLLPYKPSDHISLSAIPQILCKDPGLFLECTAMLKNMGFLEVNLNVGCPSGTVTSKGKGAGMLQNLTELTSFLDKIFTYSPLPISIKTRIGFSSPDEWPAVLNTYKQFPLKTLIIHPRTRQDFYKGKIHWEALSSLSDCPFPFVINGDITSPESVLQAVQNFHCSGIMIGRGLLANPGMSRQIKTGKKMEPDELSAFHDKLFKAYQSELFPNAVLGRMREITKYFSFCFVQPDKAVKNIFKAKTINQYLDSVAVLFSLPFKEYPYYSNSVSQHAYP